MKTFFLAFILGVFVGALATAYFGSDNAYQNLTAAKTRLLQRQTEAEPLPADVGDEQEIGTANEAFPAPAESAKSVETTPPAPVPTPGPSPDTAAPTPAKEEPAKSDPAPEKGIVEKSSPVEPKREAPNIEPEPQPSPATETPLPAQRDPEQTPSETTPPEEDSGGDDAPASSESNAEEGAEPENRELREGASARLNEGVDSAINVAIRAQLKLEKRIDSEKIRIEVANRAVTLSGTVPNVEARKLAINTAMGTKGVLEVWDELEIEQ